MVGPSAQTEPPRALSHRARVNGSQQALQFKPQRHLSGGGSCQELR